MSNEKTGGQMMKDKTQMEQNLPEKTYPDSDELAEEIWGALFGLGAVPERLAHSQALKRLTDNRMIPDSTAKNPRALDRLMRLGFDTAINYEFLDAPKNGFLRAVLTSPDDYEENDWRRCILNSIGDEPMQRERVIRTAVGWARENLGLKLPKLIKGGKTWQQLESVLNDIIRTREIKQTVFYGVERLQLPS